MVKFKTVETVSGDAGKLTYKLERGQWPVNNAGDKVDAAVRINYNIFSQALCFSVMLTGAAKRGH